ncbi:Putative quinate permease [Komagataella phaffii CBS 7435]|uniref:High-affinity glucose transporter of the major facilitator superfamily, expression is induced by low n=2 Tax=Komagataella phaffii TaxID=460519 RepID=C4QZD1_KOMPG|nr:High-affinity glucose transporter of the major facilitator superfamily, expression is induced by low [Komagataella phaffii GS115]AOA62193.1 GQ67_00036T0 [Komagataella phaffii]CAH2448897.1 Putative quinate permease [Komagataella phaffii CBS 7435]AOA67138.1 GQ68_01351T0 [Komagataella phaffii GS115]CAY68605.1 High-affinity glucose transporter of the major facilitator superfamily, expression is induced by low [Komagataella phaffii GS115]CCA38970.1 Putative quinate permease [Komagataella phaffii
MSFFHKFYNAGDAPPQIFNKTLYLAVFIFGVLGCARGYDEGYIGGIEAKAPFQSQFGLDDLTKSETELANLRSNIAAMVQLGSIGGCLLAMYLVDKFGRIRTLQGVCVGWIVGSVIQITSKNVGQLYAGRLIEGLSIGQTVVIGPCYMSEIAPKNIRGLCTCIFAGSVYLGSMLSNFINYGCALHLPTDSPKQWIVPTAIKIVIAGLLAIGSLLCHESPRWLVKQGLINESGTVLSKIRHLPSTHPYILCEVGDIQEQIDIEDEATQSVSKWHVFKELIMVKSIRYRMLLALSAQVLSQWSFAGSITVYFPELVALAGVRGTDRLLYSSILGVVKLTSAYLGAFFVIDLLGRKKALYIGITIQMLATLYFAIFLQIIPDAIEDDVQLTGSRKHAGLGALAMLYITGVGWTLGWNSIQYLINAEMLPLRVRNIGTATIMAFHFANQYGNTKALPSMLISLTPAGTFFFGVGVLALGLLWAFFFLPEIAGRSLESMEDLFNLPWYLIGRRGAELCPDNSGIAHVKEAESGELDIKQNDEFIENASDQSVDDTMTSKQKKGKSLCNQEFIPQIPPCA